MRRTDEMNSLKGKRIHIIGIGGTGMSPIAIVLSEMGAIVSGSDRSHSDIISVLENKGIRVVIGHSADNLDSPDIVLYSSAIPQSNPELTAAHQLGVQTLRRSEFLDQMLAGRDVIAIAGTHGKTTTTGITAWIFSAAGKNPGFIIGSTPANLKTNAANGGAEDFIIEADEYDNMFLGLTPCISALTIVEHDHPDCFPTEQAYFDAFRSFLSRTRADGTIVFNADDDKQSALTESARTAAKRVSYGTSAAADYRISEIMLNENGCYGFTFTETGTNTMHRVELHFPGRHNVFNAAAALTICALKEMDLSKTILSLQQFQGISRRFEISAEWNDMMVIDDYGHHPTEIKTTLEGARTAYADRRLWALWQPHTFSRTQALLDAFCHAFAAADRLLVTNIYASREKLTAFGFEDLKNAVRNCCPDALFAESNADAVQILTDAIQPGDVIITFSAGDANQIAPEAVQRLRTQNLRRIESHIQRNVPISAYSNALCGGPAAELFIAENLTDLSDLLVHCQTTGRKVKVAGGLSNVLFSDRGYDGLLIINRASGFQTRKMGEKTLVTVESGMGFAEFVRRCASLNLTGIEWGTRIPGSVGGALYGNAGAYGGDIASVIKTVRILTADNHTVDLNADQMKYAYRSSGLKDGTLRGTILSGTFELKSGDPAEIRAAMDEIHQKREKFNFGIGGSLGSIFRNPQGNYAGKLITECGLRGKRIGNVQISDFHGNIFITSPGVKSAEFAELVELARSEVKKQFGIDLICEIEIME